MKVGSAIGGGIAAKKSARRMKKMIQEQQRKNQDWYDRRYNEDATQRADAQRLLTMTEESIRNRNRQAAGSAAVMGGTEESVAAAKAANSQALADATSQIAASADARKDQIEQTYMANDANLTQQLMGVEQKRLEGIQNAMDGISDAGSAIGGMG